MLDQQSDTHSDIAQIVVFSLADEEYGVEIQVVREVVQAPLLTKIPNAPDYVIGLMNLRGKIIPVLDLKLKFHITDQPDELTNKHILILEHTQQGEIGVEVDKVKEVITVSKNSIKPLSEQLKPKISAEAIKGIVVTQKSVGNHTNSSEINALLEKYRNLWQPDVGRERMIILVDPDKICEIESMR